LLGDVTRTRGEARGLGDFPPRVTGHNELPSGSHHDQNQRQRNEQFDAGLRTVSMEHSDHAPTLPNAALRYKTALRRLRKKSATKQ
jgi:hypothetical protein